MLVDMNPEVVSEVISQLPPPASAKILTVVLELHWDRKTYCPPPVPQRMEPSPTAGLPDGICTHRNRTEVAPR